MRQRCAIAYVLILDTVERQVQAQQMAAGVAAALGASVVMPDVAQARAEFDALLAAPPQHVADPEKALMRRAMGLA